MAPEDEPRPPRALAATFPAEFWCLRPRTVFSGSLSGFPAPATRFEFD